MDAGKLQQAIDLYDRFTHEGMDRRDFFARRLHRWRRCGAASLIATIAASPPPRRSFRPRQVPHHAK